MAKKGIVASAVRAAVTAAEKAIAPSPLAKKVIAAAAAEAVRQVEQRAPEVLAPVEKALQRQAGDLARPIDKALAAERPKRRSKKSARGKASRKKTKSARASAAGKKTKTGGKKKARRAKRR